MTAGNEFDPKVMPSARAARHKQWQMLSGLPTYLILVALVSASILGAVWLGLAGRW